MKKKFYIDLDGVCFDFVKAIEAEEGKSIAELIINEAEFNELKTRLSQDDSDFFARLEPMCGLQLFAFFNERNIECAVLTSAGDSNPKHVAKLKQEHLIKHLGYLPEFIYTTCSEEKAQYANDDCVLIDDRKKSIEPFIANGGNAIHYKDINSCIEQIKAFL